jgi:polynucleotide 5'-kinase involved in rRNA processing
MTNYFLEDIAFEGMHGRADIIEKEHASTFRWVVEPDAYDPETTYEPNPCELYLSWLKNGTELFYVAGKLGSGKSTLMKFLFNHSETGRQLATWAGSLL